MEKLLTAIGAMVLFVMLAFLAAILGALCGGFTGWIIEHTFLATFVLGGFSPFGFEVNPSDLPAIGAVLGFVGAFFRTSASHSKD